MRPETRKSLQMLFAARWNLPFAAAHAKLTNKEMKIIFNGYCELHPPTYPPGQELPSTEHSAEQG